MACVAVDFSGSCRTSAQVAPTVIDAAVQSLLFWAYKLNL
jgi:hypothetical protein